MMVKYLIGALIGGIVGYVVLYRFIGCSTGSCRITANPYIATLYGVLIGLLFAGAVTSPSKNLVSENGTQAPATEYKRLTAEEAKARIDSGDEIIILDVRTEAEYKAGHIEDSILIPNESIKGTKPELLPDLDAEILIYCRSGNRSAQAAKKLISMGYTNVYDFGGIIDWPFDTVTGT